MSRDVSSHGSALMETPVDAMRVPEIPAPSWGLGGWLYHGGSTEETHEQLHVRPWWQVLWLTGVDYFSTLGYQPGIALLAAGFLSPLATLILVAVTLFGALPVYYQVVTRSYSGQGSIAMLERLLSGWKSKLFVLVLLGFAATDFVITITLSSADAALHLRQNPLVAHHLEGAQLGLTLVLLALLAAVFLKGFREAIGIAVLIGVPYMLLNVAIVARGALEIYTHPEHLNHWTRSLAIHGDWSALVLSAAIVFPRLALGLSGFETGVAVMPLIKGDPDDHRWPLPLGRIANTRKMLTAAAVMMSVMLLCTSVISTLLVPESAYQSGGVAAGRVLAYLAHRLMGHTVGSVYDVVTILILWFAGASAMAGLLNLIPRYLPRLGMAPRWVAYARPLVLLLFAVSVVVTVIFEADVERQAGAYATGVLFLIFSGAVAVTLSLWQESRDGPAFALTPAISPQSEDDPVVPLEPKHQRFPWAVGYYGGVALVLLYTLLQNIHERPDGLIIASVFIFCMVAISAVSRYSRSTELRVEQVTLIDAESAKLWEELRDKKVHLVPLKHLSREDMAYKRNDIRKYYHVEGPLAFLHVRLRDDRSDFSGELPVKVCRMNGDYLIEVHGAIAIANAIAYISELLDPISIFLGLTRQNAMSQAFRYLLWGEGETGIRVYEVLLRHWERTPEEDVRPLIFIMSE